MEMRFLKTITACAVAGATMFSCASSNEMADNTGLEPTEVVVTETEVASGTTADGTTVVVTDTDVLTDTTVMAPDRQNLSNIDYDDMFEDVGDTEQYDVIALAKTNPHLSTFVELVELSGLAPSLMVAENITVFAPTNAAFNKMSKERLNELIDPNNRAELIELIQMHTLPNEVSSIMLTESKFIDRGEKEDIPVNTTLNGTVVYVGGAEIVNADVEAKNGMLHVVDGIFETTERAGADID